MRASARMPIETFNKIGDRDEEWEVEAAIPLRSVAFPGNELGKAGPGTRIRCIVRRCDIAYNGPRNCGSWAGAQGGGVLILE